jgi:hypothetical protein
MGIYANEMAEKQSEKKYQDMKTCGLMIGTEDEIKSKAIRTVRLIQRGLLEEEKSGEYDFPLNQVRVLDPKKCIYRTMVE